MEMIELVARIALYWLFGALAAWGFGEFAPETETFTVTVGQATAVIAGLAGAGATYLWSRFAKARGRLT
jgi:hypothetical protein